MMKYYLTIVIILLIAISPTTAQQLMIIANHSNGIDTLICGFSEDASIGIDNNLGEQDQFGEPINDFEGRILQRDSTNYSCGVNVDRTAQVFYDNNFDGKINFRNPNDLSLSNRVFEIWYSDNQINSIQIISDVDLKGFLRILIYMEDCNVLWPVAEPQIPESVQEITLGGSPLTFKEVMLEINPSFLTNIHAPDSKALEVLIYPNPVSTFLNIEYLHLNGESVNFRLYNIKGQLVLQDYHFSNTTNSIDVALLNSGVYFYEVWSKGESIEKGKIIKR